MQKLREGKEHLDGGERDTGEMRQTQDALLAKAS